MADEIKNVFISHIHEDDAGLADLKALLATKGYAIRDASIDSRRPNEATSEEYIRGQILAPQIQWAGTVIVYITPETRNSEWVNWEIEYAEKQGKRIVGVWERGANQCEVPEALDLYADAVVGWHGENIADAIAGALNNWTGQNGAPRSERNIRRYSC